MCLVLVELLLKTLMKQDEHNESRICDLSLAGGNCLGLIARKVGDSIVDSVMYFVKLKLQEHKSEWRSHWAGTYALGSILEGPRVEKLSPYVLPLLRFLLDGMGDKNTHKKVKKITSRTLIRIFQFLHSPATGHSIISTENIEQIIPVLLKSIKDPSPDDAKKWDRSSYLAAEGCEAIYYIVQGYEGDPETVAGIEQRLFFLAAAAYETLSKVVRCLDVSEFIKPLLTFVLSKLETYQNLSQADKAKQGDLQSLWCGFLHVIIQKLSSLKETKPILLEFVHHANIMRLLLEALSSHELNQSVEPLIYSCFGVVALVIGEKFERYVSSVMHRVKKAIEPCAVMTDEYGNHLKRNILEAHSNILKGLKSSKAEVLIPHNSDILKFIEVVIKDVHRNESVERAAVEVLAVIADVFGTQSWGFVFNSRH
ncbi:unnamed protein product [Lactuca virosa]|uniref:Importin subunit beta-1/Transportin-1-like TPR repeats domain-containing protein n=1 Tax=Lactuca virosa TaxID=75947 RepID=A0AAU9LD85_9ASTR|nr:unnamed protein product [Lactuca virosa]